MKSTIALLLLVTIVLSCNIKQTDSLRKSEKNSFIDYVMYSDADSCLCELFGHVNSKDYYVYIEDYNIYLQKIHSIRTDTVWTMFKIYKYDSDAKFVFKNDKGELEPNDLHGFFAHLTNRFAIVCNKYKIPISFKFDRNYTTYGNREYKWTGFVVTGDYSNFSLAIGEYQGNIFFEKNWYFFEENGKKILVDKKYTDKRLTVYNNTQDTILSWAKNKSIIVNDTLYKRPRSRAELVPNDSSIVELNGHRWEDRFPLNENKRDTLYYVDWNLFDTYDSIPYSLLKQISFTLEDLKKANWKLEIND
jgi:hypothetical protein